MLAIYPKKPTRGNALFHVESLIYRFWGLHLERQSIHTGGDKGLHMVLPAYVSKQ